MGRIIKKISVLGEYHIIVIGRGDFEESSLEYIQNHLKFKIYSLVNKIDLKDTLLCMRVSDYFIGIDSGPRHLAHLADLRSISLLGPAPGNFMPVNSEDIIIDRFTCRCKSLFYLHNVSAIQTISTDDVFAQFRNLSSADRPTSVGIHASSPGERRTITGAKISPLPG